jgi:hypothetical protein
MTINKLRAPKSSFYSCEKDAMTIINRLFNTFPTQGEELKRLLVVNTKDALDNPDNKYSEKMKEISVKDIIDGKYITLIPKIKMKEHDEVKSYIIISFDNFIETDNPEYRDCQIAFDILCHTDYWDLGDLRTRPLKIAGVIDGIINNCRLSGIGEVHFLGASELILSDTLAGYSLVYRATHGNDDRLSGE